jgi:hypothetical protein
MIFTGQGINDYSFTVAELAQSACYGRADCSVTLLAAQRLAE